MKRRAFHFIIAILAFIVFSASTPIAAQEDNNRIYVQGLIGTMQQVLGGDRFKYGVEGGLLASWKTEKWQVEKKQTG